MHDMYVCVHQSIHQAGGACTPWVSAELHRLAAPATWQGPRTASPEPFSCYSFRCPVSREGSAWHPLGSNGKWKFEQQSSHIPCHALANVQWNGACTDRTGDRSHSTQQPSKASSAWRSMLTCCQAVSGRHSTQASTLT